MPKRIPDAELQAIKRVVGNFPAGASINDIASLLLQTINRRTLQRRVVFLVEAKQLLLKGSGRNSRYSLPPSTGTIDTRDENDRVLAHGEVYVPVSREAEKIKQTVRLPVQNREPV